MEYKLIVENWKKFLKEAEEETYGADDPRRQRLFDLIRQPDMKSFVEELALGTKDPKFAAFLDMGLGDGNPKDDEVTVEEVSIPVNELHPTQSQIGLADSLGFLSTEKPAVAKVIAEDNTVATSAIGGRIVTATMGGEKPHLIIDGHHRWSQVFLLNPEATIPTYNFKIDAPFFKSETGVLKLAHLIIASVDDTVPLSDADAKTDLFAAGNREAIVKILNEQHVVSDKLAEALYEPYNVNTREQVIQRIADNAVLLLENHPPPDKAPARSLMPQTADKGKTPITSKVDAIERGIVNWNPRDTKKGSPSKGNGSQKGNLPGDSFKPRQ